MDCDWAPDWATPGGSVCNETRCGDYCMHCGDYLPAYDCDPQFVGDSTLCEACARREYAGLRGLVDGGDL